MHSHIAALVLAALSLAPPVLAQATSPEARRALDDVRYLADDRLGGRFTGSPGADSAAAYLARRFKQAGLEPGPIGWFQPFAISKDAPALAHTGLEAMQARNVVGMLRGHDRRLRHEVIIVGAHYDHLGRGGAFALDHPDSTGQVHNGADDNASGSAALIAIAERLRKKKLARSVMFLAFSGEELGLFGSAAYVKSPLLPLDSTVAMINLDMVGRLRNDRLIVYGVETAKELRPLVDSLNQTAKFDLKAQGDGYGPSDHASFHAAKRPVLHLFTDLHEDYHRTTDDWDRINADGLVRVADFAAALVEALANRPRPLTFVDLPPPRQAASSTAASPGYGAYLGTIPDMTDNPGGVRLSGVRAGSPADKAGLKADDIIVRIGDHDVTDLQAMTDALRAHKPGDVVDIVVKREGATVTLTATLGSRGN
ncbi:MAG: M28 family peptidase [Gemmatimonadota bacterium]